MQEKLILIRKNRNISQQELADLINISLNQYSNKEKGKYKFNCDEMFEISHYLNLKIEEIFLPTTHQFGVKTMKKEE